jgi:hypothetical protein
MNVGSMGLAADANDFVRGGGGVLGGIGATGAGTSPDAAAVEDAPRGRSFGGYDEGFGLSPRREIPAPRPDPAMFNVTKKRCRDR